MFWHSCCCARAFLIFPRRVILGMRRYSREAFDIHRCSKKIFDSREPRNNRGDSIFHGRLSEHELPQVFQTITPVAAREARHEAHPAHPYRIFHADAYPVSFTSFTCYFNRDSFFRTRAHLPYLLRFLLLLPVFFTIASATSAIGVLWIFWLFQS